MGSPLGMLLAYTVCTATLVTACWSARQDIMQVPSLLQEVHGTNQDNVIQCKQDGVLKCTPVRTDMEMIRSLRAGSKINLLEGLDISMELRRDPSVTSSGGTSLPLTIDDGGEANVVVSSQGGMYGSIKPIKGDTIYAIEACGKDCNVLLERHAEYFNQFLD